MPYSIKQNKEQPVTDLTDEQINLHLDNVLKASGSSLQNYSFHKTLTEMRRAMRLAISADREQRQAGQEPVKAWHEKADQLKKCVDYAVSGQELMVARLRLSAYLETASAAPQPAAQPDKDAEITQLQDQNTSLDKALASQEAEIAALLGILTRLCINGNRTSGQIAEDWKEARKAIAQAAQP